MTPYKFERQNRTPRTIAILICVYAALAAVLILFDAAWWLVGIFGLSTLPALWDVVRGTRAGLILENDRINWFSGRREGEIALDDLDKVRLDTRWDFSVRVSLILASGNRIRLPDEAIPPHRELETILKQAGIRTERHHFSVF